MNGSSVRRIGKQPVPGQDVTEVGNGFLEEFTFISSDFEACCLKALEQEPEILEVLLRCAARDYDVV